MSGISDYSRPQRRLEGCRRGDARRARRARAPAPIADVDHRVPRVRVEAVCVPPMLLLALVRPRKQQRPRRVFARHLHAASAHVVVRGVNVSITGAKGQAATLKAVASTEASSGQKVTLRLVQHGKAELVTVASP